MALTDTDIGNMALARIGYSASQISSFSEDSPEAVEVAFWYPIKLDELLERWPFAHMQEWAPLTLVEEHPNPSWLFSFRYPADAVFIKSLTSAVANAPMPRTELDSIPYTLGQDAQGLLIYTNEPQPTANYSARRTNTAYWRATFSSALAWFLAMELVIPLSRDVSIRVNAKQQFLDALTQAQANAANEETDVPASEATGIDARNGYSSFPYDSRWRV